VSVTSDRNEPKTAPAMPITAVARPAGRRREDRCEQPGEDRERCPATTPATAHQSADHRIEPERARRNEHRQQRAERQQYQRDDRANRQKHEQRPRRNHDLDALRRRPIHPSAR
jgi:hypothetical protein